MNTNDKLAPVFLDNKPVDLQDPKPKLSAILTASGKSNVTDVKWLQFQPNTQGKAVRPEEVLDRTSNPSIPIYLTSGARGGSSAGGAAGVTAKGSQGGDFSQGSQGRDSSQGSQGSQGRDSWHGSQGRDATHGRKADASTGMQEMDDESKPADAGEDDQ